MASERPSFVKRLGVAAVIAVAIVFAVEGGEFGTLDLLHQRRKSSESAARSIRCSTSSIH
jgi:hypothetical protein